MKIYKRRQSDRGKNGIKRERQRCESDNREKKKKEEEGSRIN